MGAGPGVGGLWVVLGAMGLFFLLVLIIVFWRRVMSPVKCLLVLLQVLAVGVI